MGPGRSPGIDFEPISPPLPGGGVLEPPPAPVPDPATGLLPGVLPGQSWKPRGRVVVRDTASLRSAGFVLPASNHRWGVASGGTYSKFDVQVDLR